MFWPKAKLQKLPKLSNEEQSLNQQRYSPPFLSLLGKSLLFWVLLSFAALLYSEKIQLTISDLGRHLKNGEVFLSQLKPIKTNFYSYTEPDHSGINNHWLTGVVFFLIQKWVGFEGLGVFYTLLFLLTLAIFFRLSREMSNFYYSLFFFLLAIPLITRRTEIRPEGFSYLFLGIYFYILYQVKMRKLRREFLWIIPLIQVFWVNMHIFFIFGLFVVGAFFVDSRVSEKDHSLSRLYLTVGIVSALVCLLNPFGIQGALSPLTTFINYGYTIAENQSVLNMQKRSLGNLVDAHFEALFAICVASFFLVCRRENLKEKILAGFLMTFFSVLSWKFIRAIPLFGFFFAPFTASNFYDFFEKRSTSLNRRVSQAFLVLFVLILGSAFTFKHVYYSPYEKLKLEYRIPEIRKSAHWALFLLKNPQKLFGLMTGVNASAEFFKRNKLEGPIFNNYDIGSYLIYHLFPQERVFVDNRPENYSSSFFKDIYIPMQEDEAIWEEMEKRYQFNLIYFFRLDMTPWAQPFLLRRVHDPSWVPVYVDNYTVILLKRNAVNARLIQLYALPKRGFQATD